MFPSACSYNAQCVPNWNVRTFSPINHHSKNTICWCDDASHRDSWHYHWRRRMQQCFIKFYNLERLEWSPMGSDLKSIAHPLAASWPQCYLWEYQVFFRLCYNYYYCLRLSIPGLCVTMTGQRQISLVHWASNGSGLKVYWNASVSCRCSEISAMEHNGYWLAGVLCYCPSWAYQWSHLCWQTPSPSESLWIDITM